MRTYADTSVLVSIYLEDGNSLKVDFWRNNYHYPLPLTDFHQVELQNGFSLAFFQRRIDRQKLTDALAYFQNDLLLGALIPLPVTWEDVFAEGQSLAAKYTPELGVRTLDILHVATAKIVGAKDFCTSDVRQACLARQTGFNVIVP